MTVDYLSTLAGLAAFSIVRYMVVPGLTERYSSVWMFFTSVGVKLTMAICPFFMLLLYYLSGYYVRVIAKSRVGELLKTVLCVGVASLVFFLVVLLDNVLPRRVYNYELILLFFAMMLPIVYVPRFLITTWIRSVKRSQPPADYMLVTSGNPGEPELTSCSNIGKEYGFRIKAVCNLDPDGHDCCPPGVEQVALENMERYIRESGIRGVMLSPGSIDSDKTMTLLSRLFPLSIPVMLSPDDKAIVTGRVRFDTVTAEPLTDLTDPYLPDSFMAVKRMMDIVVSGVGLVILSPVLLALGLSVRLGSVGPALYSQERVGYHRRPFRILKFRSMVVDSEPGGRPRLSSDHDPRVTPLGRWMRKYRLDELPNLWNVFKGDMSLVGPRPERSYYIEEICKKAPHYTLLHLVRPGLTSWGMVRYGYASDVPSMVERMKYDILYIQNLSLAVDLRIILHTVRTVVRGEGK